MGLSVSTEEGPPQRVENLAQCPRCRTQVPQAELQDHLFAHQVQEEEESSSLLGAASLGAGGGLVGILQAFARHVAEQNDERASGRSTTDRRSPRPRSRSAERANGALRNPSPGPRSEQNVRTPRSGPRTTGSAPNILGSGSNMEDALFSLVRSVILQAFRDNDSDEGSAAEQPLSPRTRASLPVSKWVPTRTGSPTKASKAQDQSQRTCTICLEDFKRGDDILTVPCLHKYHAACISDWFDRSDLCPVCKASVKQSANVDTSRLSDGK